MFANSFVFAIAGKGSLVWCGLGTSVVPCAVWITPKISGMSVLWFCMVGGFADTIIAD